MRKLAFAALVAAVLPAACHCPAGTDAAPGTDAAAPVSDGAAPGTDAAAPGSDAVPGTDAAAPGTDSAPGTDAAACDPFDADGDAYTECTGDCDDSDPATYPGAAEICGDAVANDCSGAAADTGCMGLGTYVAPPPIGVDGAPGTEAAPVDDITEGIALSQTIEMMGGPADLPVHVASGSAGPGIYEENVFLVEGVSVLGGYDPLTWERDAALHLTIINPLAGGSVFAPISITRATVFEGFTVNAMRATPLAGVNHAFEGQGAPTVRGNTLYGEPDPTGNTVVSLTTVPSPPLIVRNLIVVADGGADGRGIYLSDGAAEIVDNTIVMGSTSDSTGIWASLSAPGTIIARNVIDGSAAVSDTATGIELTASSGVAVIDSNYIDPGTCLELLVPRCVGVALADDSTLTNNVIFGGVGPSTAGVVVTGYDAAGDGYVGDSILHNYIDGGGLAASGATSAAIVLGDPLGPPSAPLLLAGLHGNVLHTGAGFDRTAIVELYADGDPVDVLNNDFRVPPAPPGGSAVYYLDEGTTALLSAAEVDALADVPAGASLDVSCAFVSPMWGGDFHLTAGSPCIDAGTPVGAPLFDFEGDARDALPDVGPDEI